ncbi:hypothetical protein BDZ94DRAFT_1308337 [Collybia nuda]|uniref:Uncharacterized protein n=1 Tax=Collybia nuda TaxID=64659 RepID=A0A9P5Y5T2_9AGAR|nr:hypothetical protein BDZ94DRAFT_1308337 [Collybia nuda]
MAKASDKPNEDPPPLGEKVLNPSHSPTLAPSRASLISALNIKATKPSKRVFSSIHPSPAASDVEDDYSRFDELLGESGDDNTIKLPGGSSKEREKPADPANTEMVDISGIDTSALIDNSNRVYQFAFHRDPRNWEADESTTVTSLQRVGEFLNFAQQNNRVWDTVHTDSLVKATGHLVRTLAE